MMKDKKVLAGGAVLLIALFWFYVKPNYVDAKPSAPPTEEEIEAAARPTLTLKDLILNLRSTGGPQTYAKVSVALEFEDPEHSYVGVHGHALVAKNEAFAEHLEPELHRIQDAISRVVGGKTLAEVSTPEGREALKDEIKDALNEELHDEKVEAVYFAAFVTQ